MKCGKKTTESAGEKQTGEKTRKINGFCRSNIKEIFDINWYWWIVLVVLMAGTWIWRRDKVESLIAGYVFLILVITLLDCSGSHRKIELMPLWSYGTPKLRAEIVLNYLLFIPFGILICLREKYSWKNTIIFAVILSTLIEVSQFVFDRGMCELDDIFGNTIGCLIGTGFILLIKKISNFRNK